MKKVLLAILSCLYLVVTSGMQVQLHYCMGQLRQTTISFHESKRCGTCGMKAGHHACCHSESQWLKVNDNHQAAALSGSIPAPFVVDLPPVQFFFRQVKPVSSRSFLVANHSPPWLLPNRTILYGVFRI